MKKATVVIVLLIMLSIALVQVYQHITTPMGYASVPASVREAFEEKKKARGFIWPSLWYCADVFDQTFALWYFDDDAYVHRYSFAGDQIESAAPSDMRFSLRGRSASEESLLVALKRSIGLIRCVRMSPMI